MSARDDDLLVGDPDGLAVRDGKDERFDYYLVAPDRGEFGFDAPEVPDLRELLKHMVGDG